MPRSEERLECLGDLEERHLLVVGGLVLSRILGTAEHQHEAGSLHADEHVDTELARAAPYLVHVERRRGGPHEHAHLSVTVPAEGGDAARQLLVGLAREDRVDHEGLETGVPQSARLGCARIHVGRGERDLTRIEEDRLAQVIASPGDLLLRDIDGDAHELERLLQAHTAQQFAGCGREDVGGDRGRLRRILVPLDERGDAGLSDEPDGGPTTGRHLRIPGERILETTQRRGRDVSRDPSQPGESLLLVHRGARAVGHIRS